MEYRIAWGNNVEFLEKRVQYLIKEGWEPIGGVASAGNGVVQAMIKRNTPEN